jgi:pSer/pThr/pTyr-binding forkhead associated (FHA) protein
MALTIVVRSGDTESPPKITFEAPRIVIGRGEGCEVRLPDPSVSHRHASIRQRGTDYIVLDEGSTNGTYVGAVRLSPQSPRILKSGDTIRVGRVWLEARIEHAPATQQPQVATKEIALSLVSSALLAQGENAALNIVVASGPDAAANLELREFERRYVAGRGSAVDLVLEDPDASRRHVEFERRGERLLVRDLGSKNGSSIDGRKLVPNQQTAWKPLEELRIGGNVLSYEDPIASALEELERAVDEPIPEDESVPAPAAEATSPPPPDAEPGLPDAATSSPIAKVARERPTRRAPARRRMGTDLLVALLALTVLGLSVMGLVWVFGGY